MTDVTMPQLGETVTEGTITRWLKSVGDTVTRDEPLFEVSTDKVDSEVPAPASGLLTAILVEEGDTVEVGVKLATIGDESAPSGPSAPSAAAVPGPAPSAPAPPAPAPSASAAAPTSDDGPADRPRAGRPSEPVAPTLSAGLPDEPVGAASVPLRPATGLQQQGGAVGGPGGGGPTVGEVTGVTAPATASADGGTPDRAPEAPRPEAAASVSAPPAAAESGGAPPATAGRVQGLVLSPVVRKMLDEHGIDPRTVRGTGLGGRITRDDAAAAVAANGAVAPATGAPSVLAAPQDGATPDGSTSEPGAGSQSGRPHDRLPGTPAFHALHDWGVGCRR